MKRFRSLEWGGYKPFQTHIWPTSVFIHIKTLKVKIHRFNDIQKIAKPPISPSSSSLLTVYLKIGKRAHLSFGIKLRKPRAAIHFSHSRFGLSRPVSSHRLEGHAHNKSGTCCTWRTMEHCKNWKFFL